MNRFLSIALLVMTLSACVSGGRRVARTSGAVDGDWFFTVDVGNAVTKGAMTLSPSTTGYGGSLTTSAGNNVLPVRSFTRNGPDVRLVVESPSGLVVFEGKLAADAQEMRGVVTYHTGQRFPMVVSRRPPPA